MTIKTVRECSWCDKEFSPVYTIPHGETGVIEPEPEVDEIRVKWFRCVLGFGRKCPNKIEYETRLKAVEENTA